MSKRGWLEFGLRALRPALPLVCGRRPETSFAARAHPGGDARDAPPDIGIERMSSHSVRRSCEQQARRPTGAASPRAARAVPRANDTRTRSSHRATPAAFLLDNRALARGPDAVRDRLDTFVSTRTQGDRRPLLAAHGLARAAASDRRIKWHGPACFGDRVGASRAAPRSFSVQALPKVEKTGLHVSIAVRKSHFSKVI